jgi:hypothetical protein
VYGGEGEKQVYAGRGTRGKEHVYHGKFMWVRKLQYVKLYAVENI